MRIMKVSYWSGKKVRLGAPQRISESDLSILKENTFFQLTDATAEQNMS